MWRARRGPSARPVVAGEQAFPGMYWLASTLASPQAAFFIASVARDGEFQARLLTLLPLVVDVVVRAFASTVRCGVMMTVRLQTRRRTVRTGTRRRQGRTPSDLDGNDVLLRSCGRASPAAVASAYSSPAVSWCALGIGQGPCPWPGVPATRPGPPHARPARPRRRTVCSGHGATLRARNPNQ